MNRLNKLTLFSFSILSDNLRQPFSFILNNMNHLIPGCPLRKQILQEFLASLLLC